MQYSYLSQNMNWKSQAMLDSTDFVGSESDSSTWTSSLAKWKHDNLECMCLQHQGTDDSGSGVINSMDNQNWSKTSLSTKETSSGDDMNGFGSLSFGLPALGYKGAWFSETELSSDEGLLKMDVSGCKGHTGLSSFFFYTYCKDIKIYNHSK